MCNILIYFCNILIYFCNDDIKHLQHTSETPKTLESYVCNMLFQRKHLLTTSANGGSSAREVTYVLAGNTELDDGA
jgi:hypothetical protein